MSRRRSARRAPTNSDQICARRARSAAFSVFVPAFIIVLISLMGLWVPPDELEMLMRTNAIAMLGLEG